MAVCVSELAESSLVPAGKIVSSPAHPVSPFFSQIPELQQAVAAAERQLSLKPHWTPSQQAVASVYNRLGGLISRLAVLTKIPVAVALAVWYLESSGRALVPNQAIIRFEVHHFWSAWGHGNPAVFDAHFRFGGRAGVTGHPWQGHAFRTEIEGAFVVLHEGQSREYCALKLATQLAGEELAVRCISIGGCQLLGCDYGKLGYATAQAMYHAFQTNENAQVLGFFDFCACEPAPQGGALLAYLRQQDFARFAHFYNGGGEISAYAAKLKAAAIDAEVVLATTS